MRRGRRQRQGPPARRTRHGGLGALIALSQRNYLAAQVYGLILVAGLFSFLVNGLVAVTEAYLFRHRPR